MNRETSNIQFKFFIHSHFFINSLFTLFKFCFTHKSFSPSLAIESREWKQKSRITGKTAPPNSFLWGVPQLPPLSWQREGVGTPLGSCPAATQRIHCYPLQHHILISVYFYSFFFFILLSTTFATSAVPSSTIFATSGLPSLRKAARCRLQE